MMQTQAKPVVVDNAAGASPVLLICEHASNFMPPDLNNLGLDTAALQSHIAWDPGALGVAKAMSAQLDATLISGGISRLVYDCNRPPNAVDAIPTKSEIFEIPGNVGLDEQQRQNRIDRVYRPFHDQIANSVSTERPEFLVTIL